MIEINRSKICELKVEFESIMKLPEKFVSLKNIPEKYLQYFLDFRNHKLQISPEACRDFVSIQILNSDFEGSILFIHSVFLRVSFLDDEGEKIMKK